ncbi:Phospholipid N-methyltransferase (plasmid) [Phaeobacter piscinae]|uniref:Phospholipid N-methyltransferase n=1 Tax=Phaeobacter piscinae TaxID=1580596 RepID=A0ABM6PL46_9RHOB|nr:MULTISPECIES: methyltransferase type 11 [Phaeobacter]ATG38108.1 Phospholipid N-methyltransferase [Phaeobacter piscinae]AUQ88629.1 Phospholipid N-methyltransferase [Phaeobacter piscinae]AUQ92628.1 Phospholipid N-methyltransferase [Phaeobacter inhibens]AUR26434.1 Phospholipid N-methyltransferase [Phaeobacter piscinae]
MNRPSQYTRPDKPLTIPVRARRKAQPLEQVEAPEVVAVDKFTECHVTPDDVARRMVEYLGPQGDYLTLEPSAGTGQLARALIASGHSTCELTMIERHNTLANGLRRIGPTINRCFLEYADEVQGQAEFPRIIMNPPFKAVRAHIRAALSLLGRGGHDESATLVALVPITFNHDDAEELEILPADTFATAKVHTKIVRIERAR